MASVYVGHSYVQSPVFAQGEFQSPLGGFKTGVARQKEGYLDRPRAGSVLHQDGGGKKETKHLSG